MSLTQPQRLAIGITAAVGIFLIVQVVGLALVPAFDAAGYQAVDDPSDPVNALAYIGAIILVTAGMLLAFRFGAGWVMQAFVLLAVGGLSWYVLSVIVAPLAGVLLAATLVGALYLHPRWYVIDIAGIVVGAGAAGLFGISFGLTPVFILLVLLAVYDFISVYRTGHMLDLADGVMRLRLPVVLVIPIRRSFTMDQLGADGDGPDATERDALFIGLGDAVIPAILVTSAAMFLQAPPVLGGVSLPVVGAMVGTIAGLLALLGLVLRGRAHAGLPLLNGGAIAGYLLAVLLTGIPLRTAIGL
jgi:presenilin-like A22 family membrane protease